MTYIDSSASVIDSTIGENVRIYKNVIIKGSDIRDKSIVGDMSRVENSRLGYITQVYPNGLFISSSLGDYSYVQKNGSIWYTNIGKYSSISWNASIGGGEHDFHRVTSHSILYASSYGFVTSPMYERFEEPCQIGNDVWIAAGVTILRGVTIGNGAVIGAGAVVTKSVEPYSIVAGVPAKKIGQRCNDTLIDKLQEIKWWDFPEQIIKENIKLFAQDLTEETVNKISDLRLLI